MTRRVLALVTLVCLLFTGSALPTAAAPWLVCRMTGQPMPAIVRAEPPDQANNKPAQNERSCCLVRVRAGLAFGNPHYALAERSCCDLKLSGARDASPPALVAPNASFSAVVQLEAVRAPIPVLGIMVQPARLIARSTPPRAPPGRLSLLRAPPVFS